MTDSNDIMDKVDDDDILKDLFLPPEDTKDDGFDPEVVKTLKAQLAEKDRQVTGLLQTVKSDRRKRQEMKGQLDTVTETVNSILSQREKNDEALVKTSSADDKIVVDITEDGDAFIPKERLNDMVAPFQDRINLLEQQLKRTTEQSASNRESDQLIQSLVGEDDRYAPAYNKYQAARKWVNDKVIDFQQENNIQGQLTSGQALTHVFNDASENEFQKAFPGLDLASVTTAEDSTWHFKRMLKSTADALTPNHEPDQRFRQVMQKPSGLGKSANAKAGEISLTERVGKLSTTDIMDLTDSQIEALTKYMEQDEQKGGINF